MNHSATDKTSKNSFRPENDRAGKGGATSPAVPVLQQATAASRPEAAVSKNDTGLPNDLKANAEQLSGFSFDDVKVHYHSSKPAQLQAFAFTQGTDIHIGPGQEKHLPHEAWHVAQQKQGRVKATTQFKSNVNINDDKGLESEADIMGARLLPGNFTSPLGQVSAKDAPSRYQSGSLSALTIQRKLIDGSGTELNNESIKQLIELFVYRHGQGDLESFLQKIQEYEKISEPVSLEKLVDRLSEHGDTSVNRVGFLLKLILPQFQDSRGAKRDEISGKDAWATFARATEYIRYWASNFPQLNQPGIFDEFLLGPPKFAIPEKHLPKALTIKEDQWQAAAVAAVRAGWLTGIGFLELRKALEIASGKSIKLQLNRDVIHEGLQSGPASDKINKGTVETPGYKTGPESLNEKLSFFSMASFGKSGSYEKQSGIILKHLDIGHKVVDSYENLMHRERGKHVDENVSFQFLALLSPKPGHQEVRGANGQVLGDGSYMFTIDPSFRVRYMPAANYVGEGGTAKNFFQFIPHSQLASLGPVTAAGNFVIAGGKFVWVDNGSGHYRVAPDVNTNNARAALKNLGYDIRPIEFLSRGDGDLDERYEKGNEILRGLPEGQDRPVMTPEISDLQSAMNRLNK